MNHDKTRQFLTLENNRKLCFAEYGDSEGRTVLVFHGFPNSRLDGELLDEGARKKKIKIITIDRPGFGLSDFQPNRTILDWPEDVCKLIDSLGLKKVSIVGVSTGAAYAAACAYKYPQLFSKVGALSPLGAMNFPRNCICRNHRLAFQLAALHPIFFQIVFWWNRSRYYSSKENAVKLCKKNAKNLPKQDREKLLNPRIMEIIIKTQSEACRNGTKGIAYEASLLGKSWGFNLEDISSEVEFLVWHGENDSVAPVFSAKEFEKRIPNCTVKYYPEKGHYSLPLDLEEEILEDFMK